jgi:hypothetical protein
VSHIVLVCGGRDYSDKAHIDWVLGDFHSRRPIALLLTGDAHGADHWARSWAKASNVPFKVFRAEWRLHGRAAGPIRNEQMLTEGRPNLIIAFPGGRSTASMVRIAHDAGVSTMIVPPRIAPAREVRAQ